MRIIFIRHAEPDYINNTLTEKGFREARLLGPRVASWDVEAFYTSPLARAQLTAAPALKLMNRTAEVCDWIQEFAYLIHDPSENNRLKCPWDFMPEYWTRQELFYDRNNWYKHEVFQQNPKYEKAVHALREGMDNLLLKYGYRREEGFYRCDPAVTENDDNRTIVFFAHLGANMEAMGYLLGISPIVLKQTICLAPTSVTVLNAEKRVNNAAMFRAQIIGCTRHLTEAGEPISRYAAFSDVFQEKF